MAAKSLVLVYERPENLECSLGSALGLQGDASNPVWALSWGGRVSSLGGFLQLSKCLWSEALQRDQLQQGAVVREKAADINVPLLLMLQA